MKTIVPPFDSVKQYQLITHDSFVIANIVAIYDLWKSSEIAYYQIYAIVWSPFGRIFIVIVLFELLSKTLFTVSFSSLYLQICIFYHGISIPGPTVS